FSSAKSNIALSFEREDRPYYKPEPRPISPPLPPAHETQLEREERLEREARHLAYLQKLRQDLGGFTCDTVLYHGTPVGDELVTYYRHRPSYVNLTPGAQIVLPLIVKNGRLAIDLVVPGFKGTAGKLLIHAQQNR
ncbi:hypothetical protein PMAYCL1PPCAC_05731, partial [Pristionchus mayeri]